jgi:S1-C subfamily serine protease
MRPLAIPGIAFAIVALTPVAPLHAAERTKSVPEATGFIQVIGDLHREITENGLKRVEDRTDVAISNGTGFIISEHGYLLTNHHVIRDGETVTMEGDTEIKTTTRTSRIQVCLTSTSSSAPRGVRVPCSAATVYFSDPDLDLAVLLVGQPGLPYLAMGDSDVVSSGQRIDVWGYPLGGRVEVGRGATSDLAPGVSATSGSVAAVRRDDTGQVRFLQINANVNRGNSGGPVVDQEGFVVGIVQSKLTNADGIGFAVPVNLVKTFLESHALDGVLTVRRLRLGQPQTFELKGMSLRLPDDIADTSLYRTRVAGSSLPTEIEFRADRIFTPWSPGEIERTLFNTRLIESVPMTRYARLVPTEPGTILGRAIGVSADGKREMGVFYAIQNLGNETVVARYVGPLAQLAYNESVLRTSLVSLETRQIISGGLPLPAQVEWAPPSADQFVTLPADWIKEPRSPTACPGVPQAQAALAASPRSDFTIMIRAAIWTRATFNAAQAAGACSNRRGSTGQGSYSLAQDLLGVTYNIEGVFIAVGSDIIIQMEASAPDSAFARAILEAWTRKITR